MYIISLYPILPRTFSQQFTLQIFNPSLLTSRTKTRQTNTLSAPNGAEHVHGPTTQLTSCEHRIHRPGVFYGIR